MQTLTRKLSSRKLWLTVGAVSAAITAALSGEQQWSQAIWQIVTAVGIYCGAEGLADSGNTVCGKES
jgi:hypothetical protein